MGNGNSTISGDAGLAPQSRRLTTAQPAPRPTFDRLDVGQLDNLPAPLKQGECFVCWREAERDGKPTKIPVDPHNGSEAAADNPATWSTLADAVEFYQAHFDTVAGVGRMFDPASGIIGVDFDDCLDVQGNIIAGHVAAKWLPRLNSYAETSPSGRGVKVWLLADHKLDGKTGRRDSKQGVEIYRERRYFTLTGRRLAQFSPNVEPRQAEVAEFYREIFSEKKPAAKMGPIDPKSPLTLTDAEIVERASKGIEHAKFNRLWSGDFASYYGSQSEADLALCGMLWRYTRDRETVRRLFAQSVLGKRDKWRRQDYQQSTLDKACSDSARPATVHGSIILPGGGVTITATANELFPRIAETRTMFTRGGAVCVTRRNESGALELEIVRPAAARSLLERYGDFMAWRVGSEGEAVLKPVVLPEDMARALLESQPAREYLPPIAGLVNCPVMFGDDDIAGPGYHAASGLLITGGKLPPTVPTAEAVASLLGLLEEFDFQSPSDLSRAMASIITPALKLGGHIRGNVPADCAEADKSQSGKTYRQKLLAAIYNERPALVTSRAGGVGSTDESFNSQLIAGRPFIQLDNFRGKHDSPHLEAFLTAEQTFPARVPHCREINVDPSRFFVLLTSNGVETTRDFANRANIIRIRKREGYTFKNYPEGDLLEHVRARQSYYLGCVFAVLREWIQQGRQRTAETRHDFREWVQVCDWIVQRVCALSPMMDGHKAAQERASNPALTFLRRLALAVRDDNRTGERLIASQLYEIAEAAGIEIPGLREADEEQGKRHIGIILGRVFKTGSVVEVDGFTVTREEAETRRETGGNYVAKSYTFTTQTRTGAQDAQDSKCSGKSPHFSGSIDSCAPCAETTTPQPRQRDLVAVPASGDRYELDEADVEAHRLFAAKLNGDHQ